MGDWSRWARKARIDLGVQVVVDVELLRRRLAHETTVGQFFDEAQFESYRELGYESGMAGAGVWQGGWG